MSQDPISAEAQSKKSIYEEDNIPLLMEKDMIKYPEKFKISLKLLVKIIEKGEKRTISEEIDKLESFGGEILQKNY